MSEKRKKETNTDQYILNDPLTKSQQAHARIRLY